MRCGAPATAAPPVSAIDRSLAADSWLPLQPVWQQPPPLPQLVPPAHAAQVFAA